MRKEHGMQIGLGDIEQGNHELNIQVYIANRPPMMPYETLDHCMAMGLGEIAAIGQHTGNHWRKVFNVYAKLMFEFIQLASQRVPDHLSLQHYFKMLAPYSTWQNYRDQCLLQEASATALLFSSPMFDTNNTLHLIMGKGYAQQLGFEYEPPFVVEHHHGDFACYPEQNVILCPYFDYRQLSNDKIVTLANLMLSMLTTQAKA